MTNVPTLASAAHLVATAAVMVDVVVVVNGAIPRLYVAQTPVMDAPTKVAAPRMHNAAWTVDVDPRVATVTEQREKGKYVAVQMAGDVLETRELRRVTLNIRIFNIPNK